MCVSGSDSCRWVRVAWRWRLRPSVERSARFAEVPCSLVAVPCFSRTCVMMLHRIRCAVPCTHCILSVRWRVCCAAARAPRLTSGQRRDGDERTAIDGFRSLRMLWSAYTRVHFNARVLDAQECGIWNLFFDSRDQSPVVKIGCKGC